jgi:hypothetical protein
MSDLSVMVERVAEAEELERLRREVAELKARWDDYAAVSSRAAHLGSLNAYSGLFSDRQGASFAQQYQSGLLRQQMMQSAQPSPFAGILIRRR